MATESRSMVARMQGAALLDVPTYEAVEADESATGQAAAVVAIVAVCGAIGGSGNGQRGIIVGILGSLLGWLIWSGLTYLIGTKMLDGTATWGELLRTLGFAQSPGVLYLLGVIPLFGGLVRLAVACWILVAGIVAIRQALDFTTGKAVITAVVGWLVVMIPVAMLAAAGGLMMLGR